MPTDRENPIRFSPRGVTDSLDGDNSGAGSMGALSNIMFDPSTPGVYCCRPANAKLTDFSGLTTPGVVSVEFELNGIIYGMIASGSPAGKDRPFAYNVAGSAFLTVAGITSANTPTTPVSSGAWTPPTIDALGSKIIVTHPGFNYAGGYAFGYFDISSFSKVITGNIVSGSPTISGAPVLDGLSVGFTITGTDIPANTTVKNFAAFTLDTTADTHSNTTLDNVTTTTGIAIGQTVTGLGIPLGTTVANIVGTTVTLSQAATATAAGIAVHFTGTTITMSANAAGSHIAESITIAGGTPGAPLWAAGNTTGATQLAGVPQAVRQFSNRAYFAQGNNAVFTDTLSLNISNTDGVQVLTVGDSSAITALAVLPEYTSSTGVLQALLAFKPFLIGQITGDIALGTLALNTLSDSIGTSAPRSVAVSPIGVGFMANDGIRYIRLTGEVSEINPDLALPFIYALYPSRVAAGFNADTYKICTQNAHKLGAPYEEYCFNIKYSAWTGPHSFRVDCYTAYSNDFIVCNNAIPASLWQSFSVQNHNSLGASFVENGAQLMWGYQTAPMTDTGNMYANCTIRTTLDLALPATGDIYLFQAIDVNNGVVAQAQIQTPLSEGIWNAFNWGDGTLWGAAQYGLEATTIPWTQPPIFNKLVFQGSGNSSLGLKLGSLYVGYEKLRYLLRQ